jgi:hypothetical protein
MEGRLLLAKPTLLAGAAATVLLLATADAAADPSAGAAPSYVLNLSGGDDRLVPLGGPVTPAFGTVNPFYGNINPFFGNVQPFWGDIQPFWGPINPFYGNIQPFWGDLNPFYGNINPFWGTVQPFWGDIAPFWGNINPFWGSLQPFDATNGDQYSQLQGMLQDFYNRSETAWAARISQMTGKNFYDGFAKSIFQKYGIDLNAPSSLSGMSAEKRARFFTDWYDGLMQFSGQDQVDHWMATVNWAPSLTQDQGRGADAVIGLLDARITGDSDLVNNIEYAGGYNTTGNDHGAAVASLIFSEHDGKGVMGIAPGAHVVAYNPFDATNTASWQDVRNGVVALSQRGADVINVSLGVPGWTFHQGMADIISDPALYDKIKNVVFVTAAGNDGVKQTADINWNSWLSDDNLVIVGSVGLDETISSFSNTPGEACIKVYGSCQDKDKLKYHFLVAPGEMILVSDNHGGVTRMSGTSFAAPLVSGALTLLYDRWPWLQEKPKDSVQILFQTAKDLGAPGVDGVYGWGLLDVEASQSPLSFDNLLIFQGYNQISPSSLKSMALSPTKRGSWQASGASLYAFEYIGSTFRDFAIPLSSVLYGQNLNRNGRNERFQRHMYQRLIDWANGASFADIQSTSVQGGEIAGWSLGFTSTAPDPTSDSYDPEMPFLMGYDFHNAASGVGLHFGFGNGATALFAKPGFGFYSDYDAAEGGVNPILGFASGDDYAGVSYDLFDHTTLTFGYSRYKDNQNGTDPVTGSLTQYLPGIAAYEASALVVDVNVAATDRLTMNANYTQLNEATGLLGVQGMGALSLAGGAKTDALTFGAEYKLDGAWSLAFSATAARTRPGEFDDSGLAVSGEGITSSAFEVALYKQGVFDKTDAMRFALTQPLHIESGGLEYTSMQVIDRDTGELGPVTDKWNLSNGERQIVAEVLYATPVLEGAGEVSFTVKANLTGGDDEGVTIGSRFAVKW